MLIRYIYLLIPRAHICRDQPQEWCLVQFPGSWFYASDSNWQVPRRSDGIEIREAIRPEPLLWSLLTTTTDLRLLSLSANSFCIIMISAALIVYKKGRKAPCDWFILSLSLYRFLDKRFVKAGRVILAPNINLILLFQVLNIHRKESSSTAWLLVYLFFFY